MMTHCLFVGSRELPIEVHVAARCARNQWRGILEVHVLVGTVSRVRPIDVLVDEENFLVCITKNISLIR